MELPIHSLRNYSTQSYKTLLGAIFIKFGTSIVATIGNINLYFLSYLKQKGEQINSNTFSYIMFFSLIPMCLITLVATKISNRFGYQKVVKFCAILYLVSPYMFSIKPTVIIFTIFCIFIPATTFSVSSIPLLNMLWSQFPEIKHKITSIIVFAYTISSMFWNYIFMAFINPKNLNATIQYQGRYYFDSQVTNNVKHVYNLIILFAGLSFIIGSFLIKQKENPKINQKQQNELKQLASTEIQSAQLIINSQIIKPPLCQLILTKKFIYIYTCSFINSLYFTYVAINNKLIFIVLINDDHFLSYTTIAFSIAGMMGTFIWGHISDQIGIKKTLFGYIIIDILIKLGIFLINTKAKFILYYLCLGLSQKAMFTIVEPGLTQIFGLQNGTELLPIKTTSVLLTYILVPLIQILTVNLYNPLQLLMIFGIINILSMIPSILLLNQ